MEKVEVAVFSSPMGCEWKFLPYALAKNAGFNRNGYIITKHYKIDSSNVVNMLDSLWGIEPGFTQSTRAMS